MKTSSKLLLALLLVSIVPLLVAGAIAERVVRAYVEGYSALRTQIDATYIAKTIDGYMADAQSNFRSAGLAISARQGASAGRSDMLAELRDIYPNFRSLAIIDAAGTVIASADREHIGEKFTDVPEQMKKLFRTALDAPQGSVYFTHLGIEYELAALSQDAQGPLPVMDMALIMPIDNADGHRVGALFGVLETDPIMQVLAPYGVEDFAKWGIRAFIIDPHGRVLFNPSAHANPIGRLVAQGDLPVIESASAHEQDDQAPLVSLHGHDVYMSVKTMGEYGANRVGGWRFVSILPNEVVVFGIKDAFATASGVLLMILIASLVAAVWLARSISRPIQALTRSADAMASGDYTVRAKPSRNREVNLLGTAFNKMADAVATEKQTLEAEIAERKHAQARADELQQRQELILDNAGDGLLGVDADGCITFVNPAAARLMGRKVSELRGRRACATWCPAGPAAAPCSCCPLTPERMVRDAGRPLEHVLSRPEGDRLAIEYVVSPLTGPTGLQGAVLAFRDVRHRQAYEDQLESGRRAAEAASRAKSEFLANMSHEIRTPMNGVLGFLSLLHETPLNDEQREHVDIIKSSAESLLAIINDILDFSKVEAGKLTVERRPFDLSAIVQEVADLLAPQAEQRGLELAVRIAPDLPTNMEADAGRVRQVLLNLVGNAIKFTRRGHVLIEVETTRAEVRCTVADTGVGVPHDRQAALFEAFTQADASTTREFGGTGLGLIISQRLVELMGGRIDFTSEPGAGSRFHFTLPLPPAPIPAPAEAVPAEVAGARLLLVSEYPLNARLLGDQFERWRLRHESAVAGGDALQRLRAAQAAGDGFDVVLIDQFLPDLDVAELGRRIKSEPELEATHLILLTSSSRRAEADSFLEAGFSAFLSRPLVKPHQLREVLGAVLRDETTGDTTDRAKPATTDGVESTAVDTDSTNLRVLVAEDNEVNQMLIRKVLEKLGCRVDIAGNGLEALRLAEDRDYDVVFMDCLMPEMDGYQATVELRRRGCRSPIVALTASALSKHREQCLAAGMNDYLSKPVELVDIEAALVRWGPGGRGRAAAG